MTKKLLINMSLIGVTIFMLVIAITIDGICNVSFFCNRPHDDSLPKILFPIIPLFIFSLIIYKMRDEVFQAWWKFTRVWIPLSMLSILISPSYTHNWMFPIEKGSVAFFSSVFFVIIGLALIIFKLLQNKK